MSWRARFEALLEELEAHEDIEVFEDELGPPAEEADLAEAAVILGRPLPEDVAAFYRELNGVDINWGHREPAYRGLGAYGAIRLFDVRTTFRRAWAADDHGGKPFLPFDWPVDEYYAGHDPADPGVLRWVYDPTGESRPLPETSFTDYLEAALETRGFEYWQEMYLYDPAVAAAPGARREQIEGRMQAILPRLFGRFDASKVGRAAAVPPAHVEHLDLGEAILVYRPGDLPSAVTQGLPADAGPRRCLFWLARSNSALPQRLFDAIPEPDLDHVGEGIQLVQGAARLLAQSPLTAELLRPEEVPPGGRITGGRYKAGFHTGDADQVEAWLRDQGARLLPIAPILARLLLIEVRDADGEPVSGLQKSSRVVNAGFRSPIREGTPGMYAVDRDDEAHRHFDLVLGEEDAERRVELRPAELPPTGVVPVVMPRA